MKGINLYKTGNSPAPKEWEEIPEVKAQRPGLIGQEVSLQRVDGTNVAHWHIRSSVFWKPYGDPIFIIEAVETTGGA